MNNDIRKIQHLFYGFFGLLVIFVIATPHIVSGHTFISEKFSQSLVLFIEVVLGYALYKMYKGRMRKFVEEKLKLEKRLTHSYSYIGKMNNLINLFKEFGGFSSYDEEKESGEKENMNVLLQHMLVSVAKTDRGFLRFIDGHQFRTVAEFHYSREGTQFVAKVSNAEVLHGKVGRLEDKEVIVVESFYNNLPLRCVLCFKKGEDTFDRDILQSLLSHVHLLYLTHHGDQFLDTKNEKKLNLFQKERR